MTWNDITRNLPAYPMEELARIRSDLLAKGMTVYDFGTGDPQIPTWQPIKDSLSAAIPEVSQYPSIRGTAEIREAIWGYLKRHYQLTPEDGLDILTSNGSKEAVFHTALCAMGRKGKKTIAYPNPGYPVYRSSILFAQGRPYPIELEQKDHYLIKPWEMPKDIQSDCAALWINYPHNPTGATVTKENLEKIINWCQEKDVLLLSDDCYADIYHSSWDSKGLRPEHPLSISTKNCLSFMSLSKRSGLTGYRTGFIVGDADLMKGLARARANFGVGTPTQTQKAAATAWHDETHVAARRQQFSERIDLAYRYLNELDLIADKPQAGFYLWCRLPAGDDDVNFCLDLAKQGVIASPSQWLSEGIKGYVRFALVPTLPNTEKAMQILQKFVNARYPTKGDKTS
ncbi:MAG: aminotransferase class I/II-fold pyridoxal phosphate-dependent enzyme [Pseudobacteriovorax sp.]|nr:aminotransferase class I/II-fold pyridoxal phosphate-dependent enzyme [Pseudobacteriovorax sp.]